MRTTPPGRLDRNPSTGGTTTHARVPRPTSPGQAPVLAHTRALFVFIVEAQQALADLDAVADDARPPGRRKLSRRAACDRYERGRAGIAWLLGIVGTYTIGAFVHVLLVVALVLFVVGLLSGRRTVI